MSLWSQFTKFVDRHGLIPDQETVLVALSGGPDSMVLCHLLRRLADERGLTLVAAHLDHGLRPESAAEAQWVDRQMLTWDVPLLTETASITLRGQGLEAAARAARYDFLTKTAAEVGANAVALGHTADDQAETFLLRLLRGAGTTGLSAMRPLRAEARADGSKLRFIRPLLLARRREILDYAAQHAVPWLEDPSNQDRSLTRNRLRLDFLPALAQSFNPRLVETLGRTADLLAGDDDLLTAQARDLCHDLFRAEAGGRLVDRAAFEAQPPALARRLIREVFRVFRGNLRRLTQEHVAAVLDLIARGGHGFISLPGGLVFEADRTELAFWPGLPEVEPIQLDIEGPGTYVVNKGTSLSVDREVLAGSFEAPESPLTAVIDAERAVWPLRVRRRRPGDSFHPLGNPGRRKVKDWLIDHQIPHRVRRDLLVLTDRGGRIGWLIGLAVDHDFRVTDMTRQVLRLQYRAV